MATQEPRRLPSPRARSRCALQPRGDSLPAGARPLRRRDSVARIRSGLDRGAQQHGRASGARRSRARRRLPEKSARGPGSGGRRSKGPRPHRHPPLASREPGTRAAQLPFDRLGLRANANLELGQLDAARLALSNERDLFVAQLSLSVRMEDVREVTLSEARLAENAAERKDLDDAAKWVRRRARPRRLPGRSGARGGGPQSADRPLARRGAGCPSAHANLLRPVRAAQRGERKDWREARLRLANLRALIEIYLTLLPTFH